MESVLSAAEHILRHSGAPALRVTRLLVEVRDATGVAVLDAAGLRGLLERCPDRFRVLDPWRGPWRFVPAGHSGFEVGDAWVVAVRDDGDAGGHGQVPRVVRQLKESVRWLAVSLDTDSTRHVIRWQGVLLEGLAAQGASGRKAA